MRSKEFSLVQGNHATVNQASLEIENLQYRGGICRRGCSEQPLHSRRYAKRWLVFWVDRQAAPTRMATLFLENNF